jgi:Ca-activated chloride channel family protein
MKMNKLSIILLIMLASWPLFSQGLLILPERPISPGISQLELKSTDAKIDIKNGVANVIMEQVFYNPSSQRVEGEYIFLIPGEGQVKDFYLYIDGKKVKGDMLDAREARTIYQDIVRKIKDPALLEYAGQGIFKTSIFPIEPKSERKIELSYSGVLDYQANNLKFRLPLRQSGMKVFENLHLVINVTEDVTLGDIYSPSHQLHIERPNDRSARISLENSGIKEENDFVLYYSLADREINCTLLSFRPRTDRDGYFMLFISPNKWENRLPQVAKDMIFVIDVSGSMQGEKIEQAREALKFCVNSLGNDDRFDIVSFSSSLDLFQGKLQLADKEARENARYFIDNLSASGGTNIQEALLRALKEKEQRDQRETNIIFLTDGLPTEGETDIQHILEQVQQTITGKTRIFSFGVGYDVNTFLLDKLALDTQGSADYVKPDENIESVVSAFYAKISQPVLTDLQLDFGNIRVYDIYPVKLSNIFQGERLTILGRYRSAGQTQIKLSGQQQGKNRTFEFVKSFQQRESENDFIAKLWANRKVYHLLSEIRFKGENPELVESIKALGKEYGIVTPYTSYLVTEQQQELQAVADLVAGGHATVSQRRIAGAEQKRKSQAALDEESIGSEVFFNALSAAPQAAEKSTGRGAVLSSRAMKKMEQADKEVDMLLTIQRVGEKTFSFTNGIWVDQEVKADTRIDRTITYLSDSYFSLLSAQPELKKIFALGENLMFEWDGTVYKIVQEY